MKGKVRYNELTDFQKKKYLGEFYLMVSLLRSREEVKNFFKDLLTLSEVVMISRRIQIAKMLLEGRTYDEIQRDLKTATATVAHVEKWLNNGFDGYKNVIKRYRKAKYRGERRVQDNSVPFSFNHIRKKYPLHFGLINLLIDKK